MRWVDMSYLIYERQIRILRIIKLTAPYGAQREFRGYFWGDFKSHPKTGVLRGLLGVIFETHVLERALRREEKGKGEGKEGGRKKRKRGRILTGFSTF